MPIYLDIETTYTPPASEEDAWALVDVPKNYKDPDKIQEYREQNAQAAIEKMALDPFRGGQVGCIGLAVDDREPVCLWGGSELETLQMLERGIQKYYNYAIVTWNGSGFDLPYIVALAWKYRLHRLARRLYAEVPWKARHLVDMRTVWCRGDRYRKGRLEDVAAWLGVATPGGASCPGADVPRLIQQARQGDTEAREAVRTHVLWDVRMLRDVAQIFDDADCWPDTGSAQ